MAGTVRKKLSKKRFKDLYLEVLERSMALNLDADGIWQDGYKFSMDEKGKFTLLDLSEERLEECRNTKTLYIPELFTYIDEKRLHDILYSDIHSADSYSFVADGLVYFSDMMFMESNISSVSLKSCKNISNYCFQSCPKLSQIDISSVEVIGNYCFARCSLLRHIDISKVKSIGNAAFLDCGNLWYLNIPNVSYIGDSAFEHCRLLRVEHEKFLKLNYLGKRAFYSAPIKRMNAPKLKEIGERAFCFSKIISFIGEKVVIINTGAFADSQLAYINVPKLRYLGDYCFSDTRVSEKEFSNRRIRKIKHS